jgi:rod shape-determining protein MreD
MHNFIAISSSLLIAVILAMLPLPDWMVWFRPSWVLMVLIFWAMIAPDMVGVGTAWLVGVTLDLLNGTLLGEHALALTVIVYMVTYLSIRLRMSPLLQQGISVFFFTLIYLFILYCIQGFIGELPGSHMYWLPAVSSMVLWPWFFVVMRDTSKWFKIA